MSDLTRRSWEHGNMDKMLWTAGQGKETKRQTKRRGAKWNYSHVPRNSWVRSYPKCFNPRNLDELTFKEIGEVIKRNIRPKKSLVIAERTKFLETPHNPNEFISQFVHRPKERARYCEFERLSTGEMTTEEELIMLCLIEGMLDLAFKRKLLEMLHSINLTVETCIEFVQQLELIKKYNQQPNEGEAYSTNKN